MLMVNIADAKARLSEYLEAVARGERVLICNRNRPVAELRAVDQAPAQPRDLRPMFPGQAFMTDAFFEPLDEAELREWSDNPVFPVPAQPSKAAEDAPSRAEPRKAHAQAKRRRK